MYLKHNSLCDDIPIVIILKAMGLECDQEIVQLVGTEPEMVDMFAGSLEEPYNLSIFSQEQVRVFSLTVHSYTRRIRHLQCILDCTHISVYLDLFSVFTQALTFIGNRVTAVRESNTNARTSFKKPRAPLPRPWRCWPTWC